MSPAEALAMMDMERRMAQETLLPAHLQELLYRLRQAEETGAVGGYYEGDDEMRAIKTPPPALGVKPKMVPPPGRVSAEAVSAFRGKSAVKKKMK